MNTTQRAYITGFVKRANEYGYSNDQAIELLKSAESSWLGRYLAADTVTPSMLLNKAVILNQMDPEGKLQEENLFLTPEQYKKQRELAYGHVRNTLKRSTAAGPGKNFLFGGALGGLLGAGEGAVLGGMNDHPLAGAAIGGLTGGLTLGSLSALGNVLGKMKERKVTDEDIERMREHQKDNSFSSEFIPFKNMIDAYRAGKQPELAKQSAEQAPYTGVKTLGEMWNEFKTKTPTLATKLPVSKGIPSIAPKLAVK